MITRICAGRGDRRRRRRRDARLPSIRLGAGGRRLLLLVAVHVAVHPSAVYRSSAMHPGVRGNSNIEYVTTHPFANSGAPFELSGIGGGEEKGLRISEGNPTSPIPH